ncbi:hypothetical protein [Lacticaseibacillus nasuensis]|nr:hypothetical protein [Lacticaseibacillus nasuensis]
MPSRQLQLQFITQVHQVFPPAHITFVHATPELAAATMREYQQVCHRQGAARLFAAIGLPAPAVVPYLSVRSNLLLNGEKVPFHVLPKAFREDLDFLNRPAVALTTEQSLYVQLFRAILGGRQLIVMGDFPATMAVQAVRAFITLAQTALRQTTSSLVVFTQDETLLAANAQHQLATPPVLSA